MSVSGRVADSSESEPVTESKLRREAKIEGGYWRFGIAFRTNRYYLWIITNHNKENNMTLGMVVSNLATFLVGIGIYNWYNGIFPF